METIDELMDTVTSMRLEQRTKYNNIVIKRVAEDKWTLSLTNKDGDVNGKIYYAPSAPIIDPDNPEIYMTWQYDVRGEADHTHVSGSPFRGAWEEALNSMQEIALKQQHRH